MNKALQVLYDRGFVNACTDIDQLSDLMDSQAVASTSELTLPDLQCM